MVTVIYHFDHSRSVSIEECLGEFFIFKKEQEDDEPYGCGCGNYQYAMMIATQLLNEYLSNGYTLEYVETFSY